MATAAAISVAGCVAGTVAGTLAVTRRDNPAVHRGELDPEVQDRGAQVRGPRGDREVREVGPVRVPEGVHAWRFWNPSRESQKMKAVRIGSSVLFLHMSTLKQGAFFVFFPVVFSFPCV